MSSKAEEPMSLALQSEVRTDARAPAQPDRDAILRIEGVNKTFQRQQVLKDLSLEIAEGEFLTLLGPSGCGKTTSLNLVAGFLQPDSGRLFLRGVLANALPPQRRKLGMVFQSWALFPHMNVFDNIAYGLRTRSAPAAEIARRVEAMLDLVRLPRAAEKYPSQLSGGMQQRVALARALVTEPDLLLLDEPLSNLDAALRKEMQVEIKQIHERLRVTTLLVTHSQEEALVMSDRIAVMRGGRIERIDTPHAIYTDPRSAFVCTFLGEANVLDGIVEGAGGGETVVRVGGHRIAARDTERRAVGAPIKIAVRPESIVVARTEARSPGSRIEGVVKDTIFKGSNVTYSIDCGGLGLEVLGLPEAGMRMLSRGSRVALSIPMDSVIILRDEERGDA
jgi:ABC-type Fe3+/spermidine/putrescine transport system ATPase subunit